MRLVSDEVRDLRQLIENCLTVLRTLRDDPAITSGKVKLNPDVVSFVNSAEKAYKLIR